MSRSLALLLVVVAFAPHPARGAEEQVGDQPAPQEPTPQEPTPQEPPPQGPAPMEPAQSDAPPPPEAEALPELLSDEESWLDASHAFIERKIFASVLRFDRFFADERDLDPERSRSFLRWRNEVRFEQYDSTPRFTTGLSATFQLPRLQKLLRRARIEIAGQTRDAIDALFPEDGSPDEAPAERLGSADAGLGYRLWETLRSNASLGAGVLVRLPPGVYGRLRVRHVQPLGRRVLSRQAITGFWRTDTRFGTSTSAEVERPLGPTTLVRLLGTGTISEVSRGVEWGSDLALLASFDARSGAQFGAAVNGATDPLPGIPGIDRYRVYTRLRRDFYRHWIFLEVEPEYAWPWTAERGRHAAWGVAFRLEVQFQGNEPPMPQ